MKKIARLLRFLCLFVLIAPGGKIAQANSEMAHISNQAISASTGRTSSLPLLAAKAVSVGKYHACALTPDGGVKCWGGGFGRFPLEVVQTSSGIRSISAGYDYTCAVTEAGGVKCWDDFTATPKNVAGLESGVTAVSVGPMNRCVLTAVGGVFCWGNSSETPVDGVGFESGVTAVSTGGGVYYGGYIGRLTKMHFVVHTCVLTSLGGVKCWGDNHFGQLGDGSSVLESSTPVNVFGLSNGVIAISAGWNYTCAVTAEGGVKCWGEGYPGGRPNDIAGLPNGVRDVSAGYSHTCVVMASGGIKCWGSNDFGQLGDGTLIGRTTPVDVVGLSSGVSAVSANGISTSCAVTDDGWVKCWGEDYGGELGSGYRIFTRNSIPADVIGLSGPIKAVIAGGPHSCALMETKGIQCWGLNNVGQLGDNTYITRSLPMDVMGLASVKAVSARSLNTCALLETGGVKCWGDNQSGQLGDGSFVQDSRIPVDVTGLSSGVTAISVGGNSSCAVTEEGGLKCWGSGYPGHTPNDIAGLSSGVKAVSVGNHHACVLMVSGGVKCWGSNWYGQLGDGTTITRNIPVDVIGLTDGVTTISVGGNTSCALMASGGVKCWGNIEYGDLYDGITQTSSIPVNIAGLSSGVVAVSADESHACVLMVAGGVKCWGLNNFDQLGDGSSVWRISTPVNPIGLSSGVREISAGEGHTCVLTSEGGAKCWGYGRYGVLGTKQLWVPVFLLEALRLYLPEVQKE